MFVVLEATGMAEATDVVERKRRVVKIMVMKLEN